MPKIILSTNILTPAERKRLISYLEKEEERIKHENANRRHKRRYPFGHYQGDKI